MSKFATIMEGFFSREEAARAAETDRKIRRLLEKRRWGRRFKAAVEPITPTEDVITTFERSEAERLARDKATQKAREKASQKEEGAVSVPISETREYRSAYYLKHRGRKNKTHLPEVHRDAISKANRGRSKPRTTCKGCGKIVSFQMLGRWHKKCRG